MKEQKELDPKTQKTVEVISKVIALTIGGGFIYWMFTLINF